MQKRGLGATVVAGVMVLGAGLLACKSELGGSLTVDGAAFDLKSCNSGQRNIPAFDGVDFQDASGKRVRFVAEPNNTFRVFVFAPGAKTGTLLGHNCGTLTMSQQNSEVNGVKNVQGSLTANCTGSGHTVSGSVTFKNCH